MKQTNKIRLFLSLMFCLSSFLIGFAQDIIDIVYKDTFKGSVSQRISIPAIPKQNRVNSRASSILVNSGNDFDDENLQKVVDYVTSVWKSYILNSRDLNIRIEWDDMDSDIETTVRYAHKDNIAYPTALRSYLDDINSVNTNNPDGIIKINRNTNWNYALGDNISPESSNLAYGLMRAFARIMGFGSDIAIDENNNYRFLEKRYHTIFNTLITNANGRKLSSISLNNGKANPDLKSYVEEQNQTFWIEANNTKYQLAPKPFSKDCPPFVYMNDAQSLMRKTISAGDYILEVDYNTQAILNHLGWNTATPMVEIISDDVSTNGLASAYVEHKFKISNGSLAVTQPSWTLRLPLASGEEETIILKDENYSCTTPPLTNIDNYKRNADGDIEARLDLKYKINGNEVTAFPFKIYFELSPIIEYAVIEQIIDESPARSYSANYRVKYKGADKVYVYVEEEFGSDIRVSCINEPYIATGCAAHIKSPYYAWIDFEVENKYGKSLYTIELQPFGVVSPTCCTTPTGIEKCSSIYPGSESDDETISIDVYDRTGFFIAHLNRINEIDQLDAKGFLVARITKKNGDILTQKFIKR